MLSMAMWEINVYKLRKNHCRLLSTMGRSNLWTQIKLVQFRVLICGLDVLKVQSFYRVDRSRILSKGPKGETQPLVKLNPTQCRHFSCRTKVRHHSLTSSASSSADFVAKREPNLNFRALTMEAASFACSPSSSSSSSASSLSSRPVTARSFSSSSYLLLRRDNFRTSYYSYLSAKSKPPRKFSVRASGDSGTLSLCDDSYGF